MFYCYNMYMTYCINYWEYFTDFEWLKTFEMNHVIMGRCFQSR